MNNTFGTDDGVIWPVARNNLAKESLVVDFLNQANLDEIPDKASVIEHCRHSLAAKPSEQLLRMRMSEDAEFQFLPYGKVMNSCDESRRVAISRGYPD